MPGAEYRAGRSAVLGRFLARPRIFWHDLLHQEADGRARANIRAELADLGVPAAGGA